jgi:hypothetical protein
MIRKTSPAFIITTAALGLAFPTAAQSQSAYTATTVARHKAAGHPVSVRIRERPLTLTMPVPPCFSSNALTEDERT